jgi:hypothetical protein
MTTSILTIEQLWQTLRRTAGETLQRRVDASHPLDLYADFEPPGRPGLVAVCTNRPPSTRPLRAVHVESGRRADGRWSLRLSLAEPELVTVFAALCRDIIDFTRAGVDGPQLGAAVLGRLERWRTLLEKDVSGLGDSILRGLIGELTILDHLLDTLLPMEAVASWTGPLGTPQDFQLPTGRRIEVKAVRRDARTARINGIEQLDPGSDPLELAIVRLEDTGVSADGAVTVPVLVERIRNRLAGEPDSLATFSASLGFVGWHDDPRHHELVVRVIAIEWHEVGPDFPKLTPSSVPQGVEDADYIIALPPLASPSPG